MRHLGGIQVEHSFVASCTPSSTTERGNISQNGPNVFWGVIIPNKRLEGNPKFFVRSKISVSGRL